MKSELKDLWLRLLGNVPRDEQFELWCTLHTDETVRHGITQTAKKNLSTGSVMTDDAKVRFASSCMNASTAQKMQGHGGVL